PLRSTLFPYTTLFRSTNRNRRLINTSNNKDDNMKSTLHPLTTISFAVAAMTLVACSDQSTTPAASNSLATNEVAANTDVALYQEIGRAHVELQSRENL